MKLLRVGYNRGPRPSGWNVRNHFMRDNGGAIPSNLIEVANTSSRGAYHDYCKTHGHTLHPARFPREVPEFFVKFLTDEGDVVLDPFAGSNTTGAVADELKRQWLACDLRADYLAGSIGRFEPKSTGLKLHADIPAPAVDRGSRRHLPPREARFPNSATPAKARSRRSG